MDPAFVHLNTHTEYSLIDGLANVAQLVQTCTHQHMPAIALTDQMNLFGLVKFYRECLQTGVKPIVGASIYIANSLEPAAPFSAILLCQNALGYHHLSELISLGYTHGQLHGKAILQREWIANSAEGLIMLSGAQTGDIGHALIAGHVAQAEEYIQAWQAMFPQRFYLELQRIGNPHEETYIQAILPLATKYQLPVVATNAVRFLQADDFLAHEARVAIREGYTLLDPKRPQHYTRQQYLRSAKEMQTLFADIPSSLQNTVEIAKRCNLELKLGQVFLPDFPVPAGLTIGEYLTQVTQKGLEERLLKMGNPHPNPLPQAGEGAKISFTQYHERLQIELDVIIKMGFSGYFLIVADFIQWAKDNGIPVGPGRGSGAGSLVAYALKITDLDPIEHDLLFERFLNPERISMPDFDIDFCMEGRDRVIDYVADKYGRDAVSQIITYGTMAAKAVIRDVGRVQGHPYGFVDKLAKLIPFEIGITLDKALAQEAVLRERYENEEEVAGLLNLAKKLEGVVRNVGTHAGGVVIAPSKLTDFVPIYCEPGSQSLVSQFDKDDVEAVGLVKFDFLGLRTLTIIDWAVKNINTRLARETKPLIDITTIPMAESAAFELLKACNTTAVFQLESRGMKDLIKRLQPDRFDEITALVALFRPGPLQSGMVDDFINRKHGRAPIIYDVPQLEPILKSTYGVILYQEQVMQIAQVLAGYTLGGADLLRRAMGKKKPEEMAKQRLTFVNGAVANGIDNGVATHIFDLMEKFAGYGFNKSHSAAYALLSYQTAWLKALYPAEFMAAVMSSDLDNTDKVVIMYDDCKQMGVKILPPNINTGLYKFTVNHQGEIVYGLGAIKGAGEAAIEAIIAERNNNGRFTDLFSFCQRIDLKKVNRRVLEALIKSGAMDEFGIERSILFASLEKALQQAEQTAHADAFGQNDLFGHATDMATIEYVQVKPWSSQERLTHEKATLGLFLTGHPLTRYEPEFSHFIKTKIADIRITHAQHIMLAGMVANIRTMQTKRGDRMAFVTLDDGTGRMELAVFADLYAESREILTNEAILIVEGEVSVDEYSGGFKLRAKQLSSIEQWRGRLAKSILVEIDHRQAEQGMVELLQKELQVYKNGSCQLLIDYVRDDYRAHVQLGKEWRVRPSDELLDKVESLLGENRAKISY